MNILKRGFSLVKSAFWREAGFSWGRLSVAGMIVFTGTAAIMVNLTMPIYIAKFNFIVQVAALVTGVISFLIFMGKMIGGNKLLQASLARGAGPIFFLLFLNVAFGLYLAETAPIAAKYSAHVDFCDQKIKAIKENFLKVVVGKEQALVQARQEEAQAVDQYMRARITAEDVGSLRDPVKWLMGFCLGWLLLKSLFFFRNNTSEEARRRWLFKFKVFASYCMVIGLRLLLFIVILLGALSLSTFSPVNSSLITLSAALIVAAVASFYALPWAVNKEKLFKITGIAVVEKTTEPRKLFWFKWTSSRGTVPGIVEIRGIPSLLLRFSAVIAVSLLAMLFTHSIWHGKAEASKQSFKEKGWPSSLADFREDLPDDQYAATAFESALLKIDMRAMDEKTDLALKPVKWDKDTFRRQAAFVARLAPLITGEVVPTLKGRTRWMKADYLAAVKDPLNMPVPKYMDQIKFSKLLRLSACVEAVRGNLPAAWGYVRLQLKIAELVSTEPSLIGKVVTVTLRRQAALAAVGIMLNRPETGVPSDIAKTLRVFPAGSLVSEGMKTEAAIRLDLIASPFPQEDKNKITGLERISWEVLERLVLFTGLTDISILKSVSYFSQLIITPSRYRLFEPLGSKADQELEALPDWPYILAKMATGKFSDLHEKEWEMKAWAQMALITSAAGKYYSAHGRYPAKAGELSPGFLSEDLLADPFSFRELEYAAASGGKSFSLCSVGPKGKHKDSKELAFCVQQAR